MMQFKKGLGWKACYDEERNLYTAQTSWRGDYHLYEINSEIWSQLGEPGVDSDKLIHSGRHLYYSQDSPIGPPTDMVIDDDYTELGSWTNIQTSGNVMSEELTDIAVDLWENEETREQRNKMKDRNNRIQLVRLSEEHTIAFKEEMQEAFQHGFEAYNKEAEETNQWQVLPDKDFYQSLEAEGAEAYEAVSEDGQRMGGAIITANGNMGELAFLYVKVGVQSKGIGQSIWKAIEVLHPEIEVWETCTPYFDRRNIHFYINRCGFHAVEFFNEHHPDPNMPEQFDQEDGLLKFEKRMR